MMAVLVAVGAVWIAAAHLWNMLAADGYVPATVTVDPRWPVLAGVACYGLWLAHRSPNV